MSVKNWVLTDVSDGKFLESQSITSADVPGTPAGWSVVKRRLRGGRSDGVDVIEVNNGRLQFTVLPTRGMGIWQASLDGKILGWKSPARGPVHPSWVPLSEASGLGWADGFDELMCRCGLESNGAPDFAADGTLIYPLHGRIANRPAHRVEVIVDDEAIHVRGIVDEARFHFQKLRLESTTTTQFGTSTISWKDTVTNIGGVPAGMQMLYHTNVGEPFLGVGAQLVAPVATVAPRNEDDAAGIDHWETYGPPTAGSVEQVYFFDLHADSAGDTRVLLRHASGEAGVGVRFNKQPLPVFVQWKNFPTSADGYVTGIEPSTNFPHPRSFETAQGRVVSLSAGESWNSTVSLDWHTTADEVATAEAEIAELRDGNPPVVHRTPQPGWSP